MIWRGPMVTQALQQLLNDTAWSGLDYLVIDLPPGTGDIQLTLCQRVPVSGAVIVTTPQDIALLDARKGLRMFEKVEVPVLGIVENMATHVCSNCGHEEPIFGAGGGASMAAQYDVPLLGSLPLDIRIRAQTDGGRPTVVAEPESNIAATYRLIARKVGARLAQQARNKSIKFPNIVIQNTSPLVCRSAPGRDRIREGLAIAPRCAPTKSSLNPHSQAPHPCPSNPTPGSAAWRPSTA